MTSMGAKNASKGRRRAVDEDNASQHTSASSDVMFFGTYLRYVDLDVGFCVVCLSKR